MGAKSRHDVFGVGAGFHPKTTAHIAHHHADLIRLQAQQIGHHAPDAGRHLTAHAHKQSTGLRVGQHAARFNGQSDQALVGNGQFHHMSSLRKGSRCGLGITVPCLSNTVIGVLCHQGGVVSQSVMQIDCMGQILVLDHNGFSGITGLLLSIGDHSGHGFTHVTNPFSGQNVLVGRGQRGPIRAFEVHRPGHGLLAGSKKLRAGHNQTHAGHGCRGRGVDRSDTCVRVG